MREGAGLRVEDLGRVRVLTLDRSEVRNALNDALVAALREAVAGAAREEGVRALVLAAEGPAFCSGLDLRDLATAPHGPMERHQRSATELSELFRTMIASPIPVVAAVQGPAIAGGAGLVLASDLAVMAPAATMGFTEVRLGFVPALVGALLVRHTGEKGARDLLLRAPIVDAATAVRLGLVNEIADDALARAHELARELAANAPASLAASKRLLASLRGLALDDALRLAIDANAAARATETLRTGVQAFLERRTPPWSEE